MSIHIYYYWRLPHRVFTKFPNSRIIQRNFKDFSMIFKDIKIQRKHRDSMGRYYCRKANIRLQKIFANFTCLANFMNPVNSTSSSNVQYEYIEDSENSAQNCVWSYQTTHDIIIIIIIPKWRPFTNTSKERIRPTEPFLEMPTLIFTDVSGSLTLHGT